MQPQFIGIGAQKAGTSWIYACLEEHPEICMPVKEIHFFSKQEKYERGIDWYEKQFSSCNLQERVGEFSTTYIHSQEALARIYSSYPDIKIIVSVRDPISRAESHFNNDIKAGMVSKDAGFADALARTPEYWKRGLYHAKIQWLYNQFGEHRVLVVVLEDGKDNPESFIQAIYQFLEVDPDFQAPSLRRKINVATIPRSVMLGHVMDWSARVLRAVGLGRLIRFLRTNGVIELARKMNSTDSNVLYEKPVWPTYILNELEEDRCRLEILLGRKLTMWRSRELANRS